MSERMTAARGPKGSGILGFAEYGRRTRAEMLEIFKRHYRNQLDQAQRALALTDDEIETVTYVGVFAQRNEQKVTD